MIAATATANLFITRRTPTSFYSPLSSHSFRLFSFIIRTALIELQRESESQES